MPRTTETTEDGAYTITSLGISANSIMRNPWARIAVPSEDEWYKAAFYEGSGSYNLYPFADGLDAVACESPPGTTTHSANCGGVNDLTDVGIYTGSPSPNGTFDQGGNEWEWNEEIHRRVVSWPEGWVLQPLVRRSRSVGEAIIRLLGGPHQRFFASWPSPNRRPTSSKLSRSRESRPGADEQVNPVPASGPPRAFDIT